MTVRTCLLISDDPDDHIEFSEALYEISDDTVVVTVSSVKKAIDLLVLKRCIPEFVLLNVGIADLEPDRFFHALNSDSALEGIKVVSFGDSMRLESSRIVSTLESDLSFSQLKDALRRIVGVRGRTVED